MNEICKTIATYVSKFCQGQSDVNMNNKADIDEILAILDREVRERSLRSPLNRFADSKESSVKLPKE